MMKKVCLFLVIILTCHATMSQAEVNGTDSEKRQIVDQLYMTQVGLTEVPVFIIKDYPGLISLSLSYNKIKYISKKDFPSNITQELLYINLNGNYIKHIEEDAFEDMPNLIEVDLANNNLVEVPKLKARHLRKLYLENNQIKKIDVEAMRHFESLEHLSLKGNQIETIEDDTFIHNPHLFFLVLNNNPLTKIHKRGLRGPTALQTLSLENTLIPELPSGYGISTLITLNIKQTPRLFTIPDPRKFTELREVFVTFSMHCCAFRNKRRMEDLDNMTQWTLCNTPAPTPNDVGNAGSHNSTEDDGGEFDYLYNGIFKEFFQSFNAKPVNDTPCEGELVGGPDIGAHLEVKCTPNPDAFNPCQDVMGTHLLRTFSWIISIFSILGNMFQLVILFHSRQELTVYKLLMYNLGFSNLLMGIYLMVLCCVDAYTYGVYYNYVHSWQYSGGCQTFGFLALFATQLSVCTLILITIERFLLIIFALQVGNQMTVRHAKIGIAIAWIYSFTVAFLPVTNTVSSYTMIAICLPLDVDSPVSEGYVVWLLLAYILAFFQIVFCYVRMYSSISEVRPGSSTNTIDIRVARRMSMIIFSNFLCWLPISIAGLMALYSKVEFNVSVAKFLLVFIFPLNACTNPFLYAICTKVFRGDTLHLLSACGLFKKAEMEHQRGRVPSYFKSRSKERTNTNVSHFMHIQAPSTSCTYPNEHLERNIEAQAEFNSPETPLKIMIDPNNPHPLSKLERLHDEHNLPERLWGYEGERKPRSDSSRDLLEDADKKHLDQRFRSESNDTASTGMSQISQVEYDEEFAKMIGSVQKSEGSILLS